MRTGYITLSVLLLMMTNGCQSWSNRMRPQSSSERAGSEPQATERDAEVVDDDYMARRKPRKPIFGSSFGGSRGEQWTIMCREFQGGESKQNAIAFAESLKLTPGVREQDVWVEHERGSSTSRLFYGAYDRQRNKQTNQLSTPEDLASDLMLIQDLGDEQGQRYFLYARMVPLIEKAAGQSDWDLRYAQGVYTLQVAVFYPESGFIEVQEAALQSVEALREIGLEAYYYHGPTSSIVTVGTFDESAVIEENGVTRYASSVTALQRREECKFNLENGRIRTKIVQGQRKQPFSFLVRIPQSQSDQYEPAWNN